jgi:hypothetical protein
MATTREKILATAAAHGWRVHRLPDNYYELIELRRTRREGGRQRTEYVTFGCDVLDRLIHVAWAPRLDGIDGRSPRRDRLAWTLQKLSEVDR